MHGVPCREATRSGNNNSGVLCMLSRWLGVFMSDQVAVHIASQQPGAAVKSTPAARASTRRASVAHTAPHTDSASTVGTRADNQAQKLAPGVYGALGIPAALTGRVKRALDLFVAIPTLLFISPLMVALALFIRLQDGGPALFKQKRIGHGGREFTCYKFRSMLVDAPQRLEALLANDPEARAEWDRDQKLRNDPRITRLGAFIRKTSLDEVPQLFNIIKGEMSVVGPRPIVHSEIARYEELFPYYCAARPGVTGLWQVSGRNNTTYRERVELDAVYAKSWTIWRDVKIILATIPAVLFSRGAY